jgi:hypothetical protein
MYWRKAQEFSAKENNCNDKEFLDIAQIREQLDSLLVVLKYMNKK